ncbi:MAG: DivIVA domain-containing protein [Calditrichia bacterium]
MKLTPLEIRKQEFRKGIRGYDQVEVQTFLEMVAEEYERVLEDNKQINRRIIELETKLQDYQENEKNLRETLLNVQEVKKQSEESSRRQADLIIKEAELKALEIIEMARKQSRQMRDEVNILRTQKESFINRLRQILISQIELLSVLEIDDALPEEAHQFMDKVRTRKKAALNHRVEAQKTEKEPGGKEDEQATLIEFAEDAKEQDTPEEQPATTDDEEFSVSADFIETEPDSGEVDIKEPSDKLNDQNELKENDEDNDDINEFFKKGIQIDDLIKNLDKKKQK